MLKWYNISMEADITLRISDEVRPSIFRICEKINGLRLIKFEGQMEDLSDNLFGVGIIRGIHVRGGEIYLVVNEVDADKFHIDL